MFRFTRSIKRGLNEKIAFGLPRINLMSKRNRSGLQESEYFN